MTWDLSPPSEIILMTTLFWIILTADCLLHPSGTTDVLSDVWIASSSSVCVCVCASVQSRPCTHGSLSQDAAIYSCALTLNRRRRSNGRGKQMSRNCQAPSLTAEKLAYGPAKSQLKVGQVMQLCVCAVCTSVR